MTVVHRPHWTLIDSIRMNIEFARIGRQMIEREAENFDRTYGARREPLPLWLRCLLGGISGLALVAILAQAALKLSQMPLYASMVSIVSAVAAVLIFLAVSFRANLLRGRGW